MNGFRVLILDREGGEVISRIGEVSEAELMAAALGKPMITLHDPGLNHALREVDGAALAVAETPEQVVRVPTYAMTGKL